LSAEFQVKKAKAIENFKKVMSVVTLSSKNYRIVAMTVDKEGKPVTVVLTPDEMLREMQLESKIGLENIEIWSRDIDEEIKKIERKYRCS
jgi:phosphopantetheine adenylyltransferase